MAGAIGVRARNEDSAATHTFKFESYQATALSSSPSPAPTISGLSPTSGATGTAVTITGTNLSGATAVAFNGTQASYTVSSATQISASVPAAATSGPITVTTAVVTATSSSGFTVTTQPRTVTTAAFQVHWSPSERGSCGAKASMHPASACLARQLDYDRGAGAASGRQRWGPQGGPSLIRVWPSALTFCLAQQR